MQKGCAKVAAVERRRVLHVEEMAGADVLRYQIR